MAATYPHVVNRTPNHPRNNPRRGNKILPATPLSPTTGAPSRRMWQGSFGPGATLGTSNPSGNGAAFWTLAGQGAPGEDAWPPKVLGNGAGTGTTMLQLISDISSITTVSALRAQISADLQPALGCDGLPADHLNIKEWQIGGPSEQGTLQALPSLGSLANEGMFYLAMDYILPSYLQQNFDNSFAAGIGGAEWTSIFAAKTNQDFRFEQYIYCQNGGSAFWHVQSDNRGGSPLLPDGNYHDFWEVDNHVVPVPLGVPMRWEFAFHRRGLLSDFYWFACNGQEVFYVTNVTTSGGSGMTGVNAEPLNRIMMGIAYTDSTTGNRMYPNDRWQANLQIWDGWPNGFRVPMWQA